MSMRGIAPSLGGDRQKLFVKAMLAMKEQRAKMKGEYHEGFVAEIRRHTS